MCVLKRQFCGCFQPKLESEKETEDIRAFDNLSPIPVLPTKKRALDYTILKQTQVVSGKQLEPDSGLAIGYFKSSQSWCALRSDKNFNNTTNGNHYYRLNPIKLFIILLAIPRFRIQYEYRFRPTNFYKPNYNLSNCCKGEKWGTIHFIRDLDPALSGTVSKYFVIYSHSN